MAGRGLFNLDLQQALSFLKGVGQGVGAILQKEQILKYDYATNAYTFTNLYQRTG